MKILYKHCAGKLGEKEKGFGKDFTEKDKATVPTGRKTGKKTDRDQQYHDILRGECKRIQVLGRHQDKTKPIKCQKKGGRCKNGTNRAKKGSSRIKVCLGTEGTFFRMIR